LVGRIADKDGLLVSGYERPPWCIVGIDELVSRFKWDANDFFLSKPSVRELPKGTYTIWFELSSSGNEQDFEICAKYWVGKVRSNSLVFSVE
jgi:hypothetical protein